MKKIIIIPAYNEEENIEKTVTAIKQNAKGFDYVIINDCSIDRTREICEKNGWKEESGRGRCQKRGKKGSCRRNERYAGYGGRLNPDRIFEET